MSNKLGSEGLASFDVPNWAKVAAAALAVTILLSAVEMNEGPLANFCLTFIHRVEDVIKHAHGAGYLASVLVFMTFWMKDIISLRMTAIMSNIAFFIYGADLGLTPVWVLHASLLPLNCWRLSQALAVHGGESGRSKA